jgi:hypothetical protein
MTAGRLLIRSGASIGVATRRAMRSVAQGDSEPLERRAFVRCTDMSGAGLLVPDLIVPEIHHESFAHTS